MTAKASPAKSAGARLERKAMRTYLRRLIKRWGGSVVAEEALAWVLQRQKRYDKRPGGLGR